MGRPSPLPLAFIPCHTTQLLLHLCCFFQLAAVTGGPSITGPLAAAGLIASSVHRCWELMATGAFLSRTPSPQGDVDSMRCEPPRTWYMGSINQLDRGCMSRSYKGIKERDGNL